MRDAVRADVCSEVIDQIRARLQSLAPESVEIEDESALHVGHAGAASGGGHYRLTITSTAFSGCTKVARHRLVYAALGDLMQRHIHALAIVAGAPGERTAAADASSGTKHPFKGAIV
ncbi:MAG: BolA family transcriptional regulator [Proteobacteria bacterium]|nr:BolA family transcriptional regulator [Burkholderiales bacterium]